MEVVSDDDRNAIWRRNALSTARAGIPEYWIVDPKFENITVLKLDNSRYIEHGVYAKGMSAASALVAGFEVSVDAVFAAAKMAGIKR